MNLPFLYTESERTARRADATPARYATPFLNLNLQGLERSMEPLDTDKMQKSRHNEADSTALDANIDQIPILHGTTKSLRFAQKLFIFRDILRCSAKHVASPLIAKPRIISVPISTA